MHLAEHKAKWVTSILFNLGFDIHRAGNNSELWQAVSQMGMGRAHNVAADKVRRLVDDTFRDQRWIRKATERKMLRNIYINARQTKILEDAKKAIIRSAEKASD